MIDANANRKTADSDTRIAIIKAIRGLQYRKVFVDVNDCGGWDIETPWGWRTAENVGELRDIARRVELRVDLLRQLAVLEDNLPLASSQYGRDQVLARTKDVRRMIADIEAK